MTVRPWDIFNKKKPKSEEQLAKYRMSICSTCPEFLVITKRCNQCNCIMPIKTKLKEAECPLGKWNKAVD